MLHWRYWLSMSVLYGAIGFAATALAVNRDLMAAHAAGLAGGAFVALAFWLLWQGRVESRLPLIEGVQPVELVPDEGPEVRPRWRLRLAGFLKGTALLLLLLVLSERINGQGSDFLEGFTLTLAAGALPLLMAVLRALDRVPRNHPLE